MRRFSAIAASARMSQSCPYRWTGRMQVVLPSIALATRAGSRSAVSGSTSASTGVAPTSAIHAAEAKNVNGLVTTRSPGRTPSASSPSQSASVPVATPTPCFTPWCAAKSRSNASTSGPSTKRPLRRTRSAASSIAGPIAVRSAARSIGAIGEVGASVLGEGPLMALARARKNAVLAAVGEVDQESQEEPDPEAPPVRGRQREHQEQAEEDSEDRHERDHRAAERALGVGVAPAHDEHRRAHDHER